MTDLFDPPQPVAKPPRRIRRQVVFQPSRDTTAPVTGIALRGGLVLHRRIPSTDPPWGWRGNEPWVISDTVTGEVVVNWATSPKMAMKRLRILAKTARNAGYSFFASLKALGWPVLKEIVLW